MLNAWLSVAWVFCSAGNGDGFQNSGLILGCTRVSGGWAQAERGGPWLLAWPGLSGCSIYIFLTGFGGILQCCNTWDSTARSCVTFCSRIHSAQLRASSDPTAAACSWHGTLSICRGESPPATGKLTPVKKNQFIFVLGAVPKVNLLGGCRLWGEGQ